ncbi:hypothetical protein GCM10025878_10450 [Leuconostoc gasicomitatum]|uniref:Transporter n=1 Tax=Leuconostoc inhae TaxID=178001 RepID=A0AAN2QVK5_9LACO|nr:MULTISPECIES: DUF805 domain-containing protein [Leuconostoc]MBZ5957639.1 DUF805 domain-containing protein [Leuconostoc gasicomitatum]MBZ5958825.1 DUF805 domain-containing protein [Leuconostoc gasicomitatum]MBZ5966041.1 DUF805 domain-containing protein [Leuconostoc gasicomitatum]MBZ5980418.1 DUF805 domain-containing protein [Leuconostoc gasicomitatum]MBZ5981846.1 DUF805 domain-containing protein [Leuconostoc gasicomitatum]
MRRYLRYWRETFNFRGGAYRLDYWLVQAVNNLIFALIIFIVGTIFNEWTLSSHISSIFSLLIFVPNISLFIRRLRDSGLPQQIIAIILFSPFLIGIFSGITVALGLLIAVPVLLLLYLSGIIYLLLRRSAYWTPYLNVQQKINYTIVFVTIIVLIIGLQIFTIKKQMTGINNIWQKALKQQVQQTQRESELIDKSASSQTNIESSLSSVLSSAASDTHHLEKAQKPIPDISVKALPDDKVAASYRNLPEMRLGDNDFGTFTVQGHWEQDSSTLQWFLSIQEQHVLILTSTMGQGFGVDISSLPFEKIVGQSYFQLKQQGDLQVWRIDGTYKEPTTDQIKAMSYLEWHMPDGHIRVMYLISQSKPLLNTIINSVATTYSQ